MNETLKYFLLEGYDLIDKLLFILKYKELSEFDQEFIFNAEMLVALFDSNDEIVEFIGSIEEAEEIKYKV